MIALSSLFSLVVLPRCPAVSSLKNVSVPLLQLSFLLSSLTSLPRCSVLGLISSISSASHRSFVTSLLALPPITVAQSHAVLSASALFCVVSLTSMRRRPTIATAIDVFALSLPLLRALLSFLRAACCGGPDAQNLVSELSDTVDDDGAPTSSEGAVLLSVVGRATKSASVPAAPLRPSVVSAVSSVSVFSPRGRGAQPKPSTRGLKGIAEDADRTTECRLGAAIVVRSSCVYYLCLLFGALSILISDVGPILTYQHHPPYTAVQLISSISPPLVNALKYSMHVSAMHLFPVYLVPCSPPSLYPSLRLLLLLLAYPFGLLLSLLQLESALPDDPGRAALYLLQSASCVGCFIGYLFLSPAALRSGTLLPTACRDPPTPSSDVSLPSSVIAAATVPLSSSIPLEGVRRGVISWRFVIWLYQPLCLSLLLALLLSSGGVVVPSGVSEQGDGGELLGQQGERQVQEVGEAVASSLAGKVKDGWPWTPSLSAAPAAKYEDPVGAFAFHYLVINLYFLKDAATRVPDFEFSGHVARHFTVCLALGLTVVGVMTAVL